MQRFLLCEFQGRWLFSSIYVFINDIGAIYHMEHWTQYYKPRLSYYVCLVLQTKTLSSRACFACLPCGCFSCAGTNHPLFCHCCNIPSQLAFDCCFSRFQTTVLWSAASDWHRRKIYKQALFTSCRLIPFSSRKQWTICFYKSIDFVLESCMWVFTGTHCWKTLGLAVRSSVFVTRLWSSLIW